MTDEVTLRIRPGAPYLHIITFDPSAGVEAGDWTAEVKSEAGRPVLTLGVDADDDEVTLSADPPSSLLTGRVEWELRNPDGEVTLSGPAIISLRATGNESSNVPGGTDTAVTIQGIAVNGGAGVSEGDVEVIVDAAFTTHEDAANPHPGYLTPAEGDAAYEPLGAVAAEATARDAADDLLIPLAQRAAPNGVATLDGSALIPDAQIHSGITRDSELSGAISTAINALLDGAPGALDTLNELAAAIGDDADFAATITAALALKAPLASPTFTGTPAVPTATGGTNTTQAASTAFVTSAVGAEASARATDVDTEETRALAAEALLAPKASPALTGAPTVPTAAPGTNTTQAASTAFVTTAVAAGGGGGFDLAQSMAFGG